MNMYAEDAMNAMTYLNVTARLAYYDVMKKTAPARTEMAQPSAKPRKRQRLFQKRPDPAILLPAESQHA